VKRKFVQQKKFSTIDRSDKKIEEKNREKNRKSKYRGAINPLSHQGSLLVLVNILSLDGGSAPHPFA
jgi:hypothetical protein